MPRKSKIRPSYEEFLDLFVTQRLPISELCKKYGCGKLQIRQWAKAYNIDQRGYCGNKNNLKYSIPHETLSRLIDEGFTNAQIAQCLKIKPRTVSFLLGKAGLKRQYATGEYNKYKRKVRFLTEKTYRKNKNSLNPKDLPRTICGVKDGYQLDHKTGVADCFLQGISAEDCSHVSNLQLIKWEENLKKRTHFKRGYCDQRKRIIG